jgi:predicted small lipoprotein YifL
VSRRNVLVSAMALAVLGPAAAACGPKPPPPEVEDLAAALQRARADSRLAAEAAAGARGPVAAALTTVAGERAAHADALVDELVRLRGDQAPTAEPSETESSATPDGSPQRRPPTVADVVAALRESADSASDLAARMSGYRAGLLGSIAAACTAAYRVALATPGRTS